MNTTQAIEAIQSRLPTANVSLNFRDGVWRAGIVADGIALERKGATEEEACLRLLDSVMQHQAKQQKGSWKHKTV